MPTSTRDGGLPGDQLGNRRPPGDGPVNLADHMTRTLQSNSAQVTFSSLTELDPLSYHQFQSDVTITERYGDTIPASASLVVPVATWGVNLGHWRNSNLRQPVDSLGQQQQQYYQSPGSLWTDPKQVIVGVLAHQKQRPSMGLEDTMSLRTHRE
ncbi:hypothetical protein B0O80DRAFT_497680 [Mortierella sp. GBAus27b]|nr:hypothetical protein B0O80DRAFT_497680 [Mortierella sp. GBAus27b]